MTNSSLLIVVFIDDMSQYKPAVMRLEQELHYTATIYPVVIDKMFAVLPSFLRQCEAQWVMFMRFNDSLSLDFKQTVYPLLEQNSRSDGIAVLGLQSVSTCANPGVRPVERLFGELLIYDKRRALFGEWICDRICAYEVWAWASRQAQRGCFPFVGQELEAMELLMPLSLCMRVGYVYVSPKSFTVPSAQPVAVELLNEVRRFFTHQWLGFITV